MINYDCSLSLQLRNLGVSGFDVDVVVDVDVFVTAIWGILIMDQQMLWQDLAWLPLHLGSEPNKTGAPPGSE